MDMIARGLAVQLRVIRKTSPMRIISTTYSNHLLLGFNSTKKPIIDGKPGLVRPLDVTSA